MRRSVLVFVLISTVFSLLAQQPMSVQIKKPVICYAGEHNNPLIIPPPEEYLLWKKNPSARIKTANIEVTYDAGFTPEAQQAFQAAVDIWETLISSPVTIKIDARWANLGAGTLGSAIYTSAFANFPGAQKLNTFYPIAIAEKISGQNLNGNSADIFAQFSSATDWHYNPNTTPPPGKYDLVTVVMHEIGHGLGFASTFNVQGTNGRYGLNGTEVPIIFDVPIQNLSAQNLIASFTSPSAALRTQLISSALFFNSHSSSLAKIYAPTPFDPGSSISHLDDGTFDGGPNAMMTHAVAPQEKIHNPGIALNILKDIGWETVKINHQQFPGSENVNGPYTITAIIQADNGYNSGTVKLNYTLDGTNFTPITMTPTGTPNEFSANIPPTGEADEYGYFISVNDNSNREFVNPGKIVRPNQAQLQHTFFFETGSDTEAPKVAHAPKPFILETDDELEIRARITDNLGLESTSVAYYKNDVLQGTLPLELTDPEEDSIYIATINLTPLNLLNGDVLKYRISATDVAEIGTPGGNITHSPSASTFHTINVVGLEPTQDSYANDFNSASDDFFGNGFVINTPSGFNDPAIHNTPHPYAEGNGLPENELNLIYQLKIPIRVKSEDATVKFDEIALVEPGEEGSIFGDDDFYDYVVVEGSKDGGINWTHLADGYDARSQSVWLTRYNSSVNSNNISTAVPDPSLVRNRTLNLQDKFDEGDEVVIRFRLFSDQFAAGWGWCIDNLKIQIDETSPTVLHNHNDYLLDDEDVLPLTSKVSDGSGIKEYKLEYFVNSSAVQTIDFDVDPPLSEYIFSLTNLSALSVGDVVNYRFVAIDSADNEGYFPASGFIKVPIIEFGTATNTYSNNFDAGSNDFVGNFFSILQPSGFSNQAINSDHPYSKGIGLDKTSDFTYTLKKPIIIAEGNTYLRFDEIALVEGQAGGIAFGTPAFNDYVIVEGSKDEGETWSRFIDGYDAISQSAWLAAYNNQQDGTASLYRTRSFDMTENGNFDANDKVIIRFRMFSNESNTGWGWAIDNLYIQDPITGTEKKLESAVSIYPNPAKGNITIEAQGLSTSHFTIQLMNLQGSSIYSASEEAVEGKMTHIIESNHLRAGVYLAKISNGNKTIIKKVVKTE